MIKIIADGTSMDLRPDLRIQLTIENPLFSADRIPVAFTTNIDFPLTQTNLKAFGFQDKLLLRPTREKIPAMLYINELRIMEGTLCFDSCEDKSIKASLVGVTIEDFLSKDLISMNLQQWVFGPLTNEEKKRYNNLLVSAEKGDEVFVCGPVATSGSGSNPSRKDYINYTINGNYYSIRYPDVISFHDAFSPAVRLSYLLTHLLSNNIVLDDFNLDSLHDIVLISGAKLNLPYEEKMETGGLEEDPDNPGRYLFSLSSALPEVQAGELLKELLKMFCLSVYAENNKYLIRSNAHIIDDKDFEDWSGKIADTYSVFIEKGKSYKYGFSSAESAANITSETIKVESIWAMLNHPGEFAEETYFEIESTNDIFLRDGYRETDESGKVTFEDYQYELILQGGQETLNTEDDDTYDSTVNISLPKLYLGSNGTRVIYNPPSGSQSSSGSKLTSVCWAVPMIEAPASGSRLTNLSLAIYIGEQPMFVKKNTWETTYLYPTLSPNGYNIFGEKISDATLRWGGENGLFNAYHKDFSAWIRKDRLKIRFDVNLSAADLRNLRLYKKKMIDGKKFLISQLNVEIEHDGLLPADVEFIEAPDPD